MGVESVRIPRIQINGVHSDVTKPSHLNPEGSILTKLQDAYDQSHVVISSKPHVLISIPPPLPHHPNGSEVMWHASVGDNQIQPWKNPEGWFQLAQNKEYLDAVQEHALVETGFGNSVYFMFGWSPLNSNPPLGLMRQSAQTQIRPHEHVRPSLETIPVTDHIVLTPDADSETLRKFSICMDFGSPLIRKHFPELKDFSSREQTWTQFDGAVVRHAYGFLTLHDALNQLVTMHTRLHPTWKQEMLQLYDTHRDEFADPTAEKFRSLLLFPPGVSASAFFPNAKDRQIMGLASDDPHAVWVSFGTPLSKTTTVDGIWLDRK